MAASPRYVTREAEPQLDACGSPAVQANSLQAVGHRSMAHFSLRRSSGCPPAAMAAVCLPIGGHPEPGTMLPQSSGWRAY
jgi:hypothetical protein